MDGIMASFNQYYVSVFTPYMNFDGRVARRPFWMFVLFNFVIAALLGWIAGILHFSTLSYLYSLAVLVPSLGLGVRRLHDIGKPWTWMLLGLIPFVNLYLLYLAAQPSQPGDNEFGPMP